MNFQQLSESLDKPYPVKLNRLSKEYYRTTFKPDDGSTIIVRMEGQEHIDDYDHLDWEIDFERNGTQELTGQGDAFRIYATVMKLIREFVKKEKPKYMTVAAAKDKANNKQLQGRERLYKRLLQKNLGKSYNITSDTSSSGTMFNLERK